MEALAGKGPFTVFAPSNAAFDAMPNEVRQHLLDPANVKDLIDVLKMHVLACEGVIGDPASRRCFNNGTLGGRNVWLKAGSPTAQVSWDHGFWGPTPTKTKANVTLANQFAVNGVMHVVDQVFLSSDILGHLCRPYNFSEPINQSKCYAHFCSVCPGLDGKEICYNSNTHSCCATYLDMPSTCHRGTHACAGGSHHAECCDLSVSKPCFATYRGSCIPKDATCCGGQGELSCKKDTTCCGLDYHHCCSDATQVCYTEPSNLESCSNKSVVV